MITVINRHFKLIRKRREPLASGRTTDRSERDDRLFGQHPQPGWVVDRETMAFLAVNEAAIRHYGYSWEEFETMALKALYPPEQIADLVDEFNRRRLSRTPQSGLVAAEWKNRKKD